MKATETVAPWRETACKPFMHQDRRVPTRILIMVHGYPPTFTGGAEQRAARTARGLRARGYDVRVLCVESIMADHDGVRWQDSVQDDVPVRRLAFRLGSGPRPFRQSYENPFTAAAFAALVEEWRPDVVYLFSGYLMSASVVRAAVERGLPIVIALTDYWWLCHRITLLTTRGARCAGPSPLGCARCHAESRRRFRLPARFWPGVADAFWAAAAGMTAVHEHLGAGEQAERGTMLRETLQLADALISPSRYLANVYIQHGADPDRIHIWRQGVDLDRCLLRAPSHELRIGYIGQVKPHKGVHLLLDAWERLSGPRPRRLAIYGQGDGSYAGAIQERIARMDGVRWEGHYVGAEVWNVLASLDAIVVPSRWVENSPNSILEAQAVGVPVIGSDLGGIAELVRHDVNGLLFAPDDAGDLARQLQRLLDEPALLPRLREADTAFLSVDDQLEHLIALFERLTRQSANVARSDALEIGA